jgi:predicted ATPase with chaperone activity
MEWDDGLTGPALKIAQADQSPLRVVAGPGTGKTFAIMRRVARLLHTGNDPDSIFLCSFILSTKENRRVQQAPVKDKVR